MGAELILREKLVLEGTVTEIVVWRVSPSVPGSAHPFKYRFKSLPALLQDFNADKAAWLARRSQ